MPKVSIIIPTYNRVHYLKATIESILSQDYSDYEIIITDNASSDTTPALIKEFNEPRIVYHRNKENLGIVKNHNIALSLCQGQYIHIFSDDDIMLAGSLSEKVTILERFQNVGIVHSDIVEIDENGAKTNNEFWVNKFWVKWKGLHSRDTYFEKKEYHYYLYHIYNIIYMPAVMVRRSVIDKVGYMNENLRFLLDWDYWLKITLFYDVFYVNKKLVAYRVHKKNITNNMSGEVYTSEIKMIKDSLKADFPNHNWLNRSRWKDILVASGYYSSYKMSKIVYFFCKMILKKLNKR